MCVIAIVDNARPSSDMVRAFWDENPNGGGVAWQERCEDGSKLVQWRKGLSLQSMQDFALTLPTPFVLHFRIPSVGGSLAELTHPFPLDEYDAGQLTGSNEAGVLFHNGTWVDWKKHLIALCIGNGIPLPDGVWSDTRAMAFVASHIGVNVLELIDEKVVVMLPDDIRTFGYWTKEDGIYVSNTHWKRKLQGPRGLLPAAHAYTQSGNNRTNGSGNNSTAPTSPASSGTNQLGAFHHTGLNDCTCNDCIVERVQNRLADQEAAKYLGVPFVEGASTPPPDPKVTDLKAAGERIKTAKAILDAMSKNSLKRLRKRPTKYLTEMEKRILSLDSYQQRKANEEKYGKSVH